MPYFFGFLITTFDQLNYIIDLGAKAVYLTEDICFELSSAKCLCEKHKVQIRAFPNVAQSSLKSAPALTKFFIRPEDVKYYEDVIDIFEFWGPLDRQFVLYKIYNKGLWFGDLKELILGLDIDFDSRRILPNFAELRKDCGRKCMKGKSCRICNSIFNISKLLEERHFIIRQNKNN
jgi:hypothetical protein